MWALKNEMSGDIFHFLTGQEYSIGRKDCDIDIVNDISISRKHALLRVSHSEINLCDPSKKSDLLIKDLSKYGTRVQNERIGQLERLLHNGDSIVCGTGKSNRFTVVCVPILVTTSCLSSQLKKDIKKMVLRLGGNVASEWCEGCTHVVMSTLSVTIKVVSALLSQAFIVNATYFKDHILTIEKHPRSKLPPVEDYLPIMAESQISSSDVSFGPNSSRSALFVDKVFIFLVKDQFTRLSPAITLGSGQSQFVDVSVEPFKLQKMHEAVVSNNNNCVLFPDRTESKGFKTILTLLKRHKLRMIPESEVGFAVLYCSTEKYCNASVQLQNSQAFPGFDASQQNSEVSQDLFTNPSFYKKEVTNITTEEDMSTAYPSMLPCNNHVVESTLDSQLEEVSIKQEPPTQLAIERIANFSEMECSVQETDHQRATIYSNRDILKGEVIEEINDIATPMVVTNNLESADQWNVGLKNPVTHDEPVFEGITIVEEKELYRNRSQNISDCGIQGGVMWKGRNVKNYKKFFKSGKERRINSSIPMKKIIHRIDLMPHVDDDVYDAVAVGGL